MILPKPTPINRLTPLMDRTPEADNALATIRDAYVSQRDAMYPLHTEWWAQCLFANGVQNINIDQTTGMAVSNLTPQSAWSKPRVTWNLIDTAIQRMSGLLLQRPAEVDIRSTTDDEDDIQAAEVADRICDWAYQYHRFPEIESECVDWMVKVGVGVLTCFWDPQAGEDVPLPDGSITKTGMPVAGCDSPLKWLWDPRATRYIDLKWALRVTNQTEEFLIERFPDKAEEIEHRARTLSYANSWEYALLSTSRVTRSGDNIQNMRDKGAVRMFELFETPCPKYPEGRIIVAIGSGEQPDLVLGEGPNVYGRIPAIPISLSLREGQLLGKTPIKWLLSPQRELNRRRTQIIRHCDLLGSPKGIAPSSFDMRQLDNEQGGFYQVPDNAPFPPSFINPPPLGQEVFESEKSAIAMMNMMLEPATLTPMENIGKANSAIQIQQLVDVQGMLAKPYLRQWELGLELYWQMYIDIFRRHAQFPINIQPLGSQAVSAWPYVSGKLITHGIALRVLPGSTAPQTPSATHAMWLENFKVGAASPMNPSDMKAFYSDIGRPDLARLIRDKTAQRDKAYRNLMKLRKGQFVQADEMVDDPETHLEIYKDWMSTSDYEVWKAMNPPAFDMNLRMVLTQFQMILQMKIQAEMEQQAAMQQMMNPQPDEDGKPSSASKVQGQAQGNKAGNPMGGANPTASQGFSKRPNMFQNAGGKGNKSS